MTRAVRPALRRWMLRGSLAGLGLAAVVIGSAGAASADGGLLGGVTDTVGQVAPVARPVTDAVKPVTGTVDKATAPVQHTAQRVAEPVAKPVVKPVVRVVQKAAAPVVKPVHRTVTEATRPVTAPVEKVAAEFANPLSRNVVAPVTRQVDRVVEPVTTAVTEPVAKAVEKVAVPVVEKVAVPVVERVSVPVQDVAEVVPGPAPVTETLPAVTPTGDAPAPQTPVASPEGTDTEPSRGANEADTAAATQATNADPAAPITPATPIAVASLAPASVDRETGGASPTGRAPAVQDEVPTATADTHLLSSGVPADVQSPDAPGAPLPTNGGHSGGSVTDRGTGAPVLLAALGGIPEIELSYLSRQAVARNAYTLSARHDAVDVWPG